MNLFVLGLISSSSSSYLELVEDTWWFLLWFQEVCWFYPKTSVELQPGFILGYVFCWIDTKLIMLQIGCHKYNIKIIYNTEPNNPTIQRKISLQFSFKDNQLSDLLLSWFNYHQINTMHNIYIAMGIMKLNIIFISRSNKKAINYKKIKNTPKFNLKSNIWKIQLL